MSVLAYHPMNEKEIFNNCNKQCGIITTTEDQAFFALGCLYCPEKFLYFDAFIGHIQTDHADLAQNFGFGNMFNDVNDDCIGEGNAMCHDQEDLTDADPSLLEPPMVMIKEEVMDEDVQNDALITGMPYMDKFSDVANSSYHIKQEHKRQGLDAGFSEQEYHSGSFYKNFDYSLEDEDDVEDEDANYDDLVEESLLGDSGLTMHIKDRKMIQFLIDSYHRNPFLWDHLHPQFRDRTKRQHFLDWVINEFKRRFNITLAKDAVTRKWDNLRTVYKRECNRMSQEKTNVSTLWYFKELHFLNRLYGGNQKMSEAVVKETVCRRRYSALWNDVSTGKLLTMVKQYPCFYDKHHVDYRSKEKRGEALQVMAGELQKIIDVSTIQISKRISQLRFDYSKQKQERLQCEANNKVFVPNYTYYDQMYFMDADVAPFKCGYCSFILQTPRELDVHVLSHQPTAGYICTVCHMNFNDVEQFNIHKQMHLSTMKDVKYNCDLCTASFRDKSTYDEHMRRHNDELLLPSLAAGGTIANPTDAKAYMCEMLSKKYANSGYHNSHRAQHSSERNFKCDYPHCGKKFAARQSLMEHVRLHYSDEEYKCDICGKGFKSLKNLANHKQIHDAIKRYVCKICGSAFAQAAGLYLHKRRHNRPNARQNRQSY